MRKPTIAIISLNPGSGGVFKDKAKFESGDFSPTRNAPYFGSPNRMSDAIRDLFADDIRVLYYETVAFFVCFFRSHSWSDIPRPTRQEMKKFCFPITKEMIETFTPRGLVVISFKTHDYLNQQILRNNERNAFESNPPLLRKNGDRLVQESQWHATWGILPVFSTLHLTAARGISREEREMIRERFHDWTTRNRLSGGLRMSKEMHGSV